MKENRGIHHKKKKWTCTDCGKIRFSKLGVKRAMIKKNKRIDKH